MSELKEPSYKYSVGDVLDVASKEGEPYRITIIKRSGFVTDSGKSSIHYVYTVNDAPPEEYVCTFEHVIEWLVQNRTKSESIVAEDQEVG